VQYCAVVFTSCAARFSRLIDCDRECVPVYVDRRTIKVKESIPLAKYYFHKEVDHVVN
jgi:hypothetical protein